MRQGEDVVEVALIIHQHIGMDSVGSPGIGTRPFSLVLIHIDPTVFKALL